MALDTVDHPAWTAAAGTAAAYLLVLGVLFVVLFAVPYLLVSL
jgi:hypothetical protein